MRFYCDRTALNVWVVDRFNLMLANCFVLWAKSFVLDRVCVMSVSIYCKTVFLFVLNKLEPCMLLKVLSCYVISCHDTQYHTALYKVSLKRILTSFPVVNELCIARHLNDSWMTFVWSNKLHARDQHVRPTSCNVTHIILCRYADLLIAHFSQRRQRRKTEIKLSAWEIKPWTFWTFFTGWYPRSPMWEGTPLPAPSPSTAYGCAWIAARPIVRTPNCPPMFQYVPTPLHDGLC